MPGVLVTVEPARREAELRYLYASPCLRLSRRLISEPYVASPHNASQPRAFLSWAIKHVSCPLPALALSRKPRWKCTDLHLRPCLTRSLQAVIGNYAVPILEERGVWGTNDETRTAYLDSQDVARMTMAALRWGKRHVSVCRGADAGTQWHQARVLVLRGW